jgi:hypothetical protein
MVNKENDEEVEAPLLARGGGFRVLYFCANGREMRWEVGEVGLVSRRSAFAVPSGAGVANSCRDFEWLIVVGALIRRNMYQTPPP